MVADNYQEKDFKKGLQRPGVSFMLEQTCRHFGKRPG
jgi:hypothetical protein